MLWTRLLLLGKPPYRFHKQIQAHYDERPGLLGQEGPSLSSNLQPERSLECKNGAGLEERYAFLCYYEKLQDAILVSDVFEWYLCDHINVKSIRHSVANIVHH